MINEILEQINECNAAITAATDRRNLLLRDLESRQDNASKVLNRFRRGECIVNTSGRLYWVTDSGDLLDCVLPPDRQGLDELVASGVIGFGK